MFSIYKRIQFWILIFCFHLGMHICKKVVNANVLMDTKQAAILWISSGSLKLKAEKRFRFNWKQFVNLWENNGKCFIVFRSNLLLSVGPIPTIHRITKVRVKRPTGTAVAAVQRAALTVRLWGGGGIERRAPHSLGWLTGRQFTRSRRKTVLNGSWSWFWSKAKLFNSN